MGAQNFSHWTTKKVPHFLFLMLGFYLNYFQETRTKVSLFFLILKNIHIHSIHEKLPSLLLEL